MSYYHLWKAYVTCWQRLNRVLVVVVEIELARYVFAYFLTATFPGGGRGGKDAYLKAGAYYKFKP